MATTINESNRKFYNLFLHMGVPIFDTSSTRRPPTKRQDEDRLRPNGAETHDEKTGTELKQEPDGTEVESASPNSLHLLVGHGLNLANHKIQGVRIRAPVSNCGGEGLLYSFAAIDVRICVLCRKNQPLRRLLHQSTGDAISHISQL